MSYQECRHKFLLIYGLTASTSEARRFLAHPLQGVLGNGAVLPANGSPSKLPRSLEWQVAPAVYCRVVLLVFVRTGQFGALNFLQSDFLCYGSKLGSAG